MPITHQSFAVVRSWLPKFAAFALAALSISTAHYFGYVERLPPQIAIVGGLKLASGVTATFLFFVAAGLVFARIFSHALASQWFLQRMSVDMVFARLVRRNFAASREIVDMHRRALNADGWITNTIRVILFFAFIYLSYVRPPREIPRWELLFALALIGAGVLARAGFLLISPWRILRRIRNSRRVGIRVRFGEQIVLGLVGLAVMLSYIAGQARMKHVASLGSVAFTSNNFSGNAKVLISAGDTFLLTYKVGDLHHFVIVSETAVINIEARASDGVVLP